MPPPPKAARRQLTHRFQKTLTTVADRSSIRLQKMWDGLDTYDEDEVAAFKRVALPLVRATKTATVGHAVGYYSTAAGVKPPSIKAATVKVHADLREPFISVWSALAHGDTRAGALAAGRSRCDTVMRNFVTSTGRRTGDIVASKSKLHIVGWQRVPDAKACAWCRSKAGRYSSAEAADFGHSRCGCTVEPIFE